MESALRRALDAGIACIFAPAGSGKTTLLETFESEAIAVRLDRTDDAAAAGTAIVRAAVPRALDAWRAFARRKNDDPAALAQWLAARMRAVELPLIIDDLHRLSPSVCTFIGQLVDDTAPHIRWILAADQSVSLPIGSWIARRWMSLPLIGEDLAFTAEEVGDLAAAQGLEITGDVAAKIVEDVAGWPIGVQFALEGRARGIGAIAGLDRYFDQLWPQFTDVERQVLISLAIGGRLSRTQLETAVPQPLPSLKDLAESIPLLSHAGGTLAMHPTLESLVLDRAKASGEALFEDVLRRLVVASVGEGDIARGLRLSAQHQQWELVLWLLDTETGRLLDDGNVAILREVVDALPIPVRSRPTARALRGLLAEREGQSQVAEATLRRLSGLHPLLKRVIALRLGSMAIMRGDAETALADVAPYFQDEPRWACDAQLRASNALGRLGRLTEARERLNAAMALLEDVPIALRASLYDRVAFVQYYLSDYGAAQSFALKAIELAREIEDSETLQYASSKLFSIAQWTEDLLTLQGYASQWLEAARAHGDGLAIAYALCASIGLAAEMGDASLYEARYEEFRRLARPILPEWDLQLRWARALYDIGNGRSRQAAITMAYFAGEDPAERAFATSVESICWIAAGERERAKLRLGQSVGPMAVNTPHGGLQAAFGTSYRALVHWCLDQPRAAIRALPMLQNDFPTREITILSVIRSIVHTPPAIMTSAKYELFLGPLSALELHGHVRLLRALYSDRSTASLSPTEMRVFSELKRGGTSFEVANRLGMSGRTVDWHIQKVCSRIGCSGRAAAIAYLVEQGSI